ncbi:uncharacterized protein LOC143861472 [Tasmannia lanceolata]|uniref:uncharacterized protein LOC143861472 n=1 Tax=Tasmannia lanceolata TaxID=3420 RepID=UPI00406330E4
MPRQPANRRMLILQAATVVIFVAATVRLRVRLYLEQNITRAPYESGYSTYRTFVRHITQADDHVLLFFVWMFGFRKFAGEMATSAGTTKKKGNVTWNGTIDGVLLEVSNVLNKTLTKDNVKNRLKTLKTSYRTLNSIINLSGFGWDETLCKVSVDEEVKNDYLKIHLEHQRFVSKRYPLYEEMKAVCNDDYAHKEEVRDRRADPTQATQDTPGASSSIIPVGLDDMDDSFLRTPPHARASLSTLAVDVSKGFSDSSPIRGPTSASGGKKSKKRPNAALLSELQVVSSSINRVADTIISTSEVHSLPNLKDAMLNIGDFAGGELIDAYDYMYGHHKEADAFLFLDEMDRVEMLGRILRRLAMQ